MNGDAVLIYSGEILQNTEGGFIVLCMGSITVRFKKGEYRSNIRVGADSDPIDTADGVLIYFLLDGKIRVERINRSNLVDGIIRLIRIHVWNLVHGVDG